MLSFKHQNGSFKTLKIPASKIAQGAKGKGDNVRSERKNSKEALPDVSKSVVTS